MKISNSVSFTKLGSFGDRELQDLFTTLLSAQYTEEQGFGFDNLIFTDNILSGRLVKRTPTTIAQFDLLSGKFIDEQIFIFSELEFAVDPNFGLLQTYGAVKETPKVRNALTPLLNTSVQIDPVHFSPFHVYSQLLKVFSNTYINNLSVTNFQHQEGVVGDYTIKTAEPDLVLKIFQKYGHDVVRFTCSVTDSLFGNFTITISSKGSLRISCHEDQFYPLLQELKSVLFTGEDRKRG